ncbi:MAG TPA: DoxX family protein [Candidatus Limnocylindrales bacterium]|nr:DoxX family protein [Candidatus Limnocylindrales bacterium]
MDLGLLIIRVVVGGLIAGHGAQKLFGRLGGGGIAATGGYLESMGLRPGRLLAALAGFSELTGGLLLAVGLLPPLAALLIVSTMAVAARTAHAGRGLWIFNGGAEYTLTVAAIAVGVAIVGPGALSADHSLGIRISGIESGVGALAGGLIGAAAILALRDRAVLASSHDGSSSAGMSDSAAM